MEFKSVFGCEKNVQVGKDIKTLDSLPHKLIVVFSPTFLKKNTLHKLLVLLLAV